MLNSYDYIIVGGGAGGIAVASSILKRTKDYKIAIIEPMDVHYYQPAWTLVGGGAFNYDKTARSMEHVMPAGVDWIKAAAATFEPDDNQITLADGQKLSYKILIVAAGLKLNWDGVEGLKETLGKNGVTSNYLPGLSRYTWELVNEFVGGKAIFTQPPMPIKCAGAPQKALYLSCSTWRKSGVLNEVDVEFHTATPGLFGVADFVPTLMAYMNKYNADLNFQSNLVKINGEAKLATFKQINGDGNEEIIEKSFDMIHVTPPQCAPDFIKSSPLADGNGWVDVDHNSLRHVKYENIYGVGDCMSAPNAKTAAAVRKQAPIVACNSINSLKKGHEIDKSYTGYGACPLTVEHGKVVLAEFGYGGKLEPTFPIEPTKASSLNWLLKEKIMPPVYWKMLLKGHEWLAKP